MIHCTLLIYLRTCLLLSNSYCRTRASVHQRRQALVDKMGLRCTLSIIFLLLLLLLLLLTIRAGPHWRAGQQDRAYRASPQTCSKVELRTYTRLSLHVADEITGISTLCCCRCPSKSVEPSVSDRGSAEQPATEGAPARSAVQVAR